MIALKRILFGMLLLLFAQAAFGKKAAPFVFKPSTGDGPFPVVVWLHGYRGYSPEGYMPGESHESMQKHADDLGAVIVGFPATTDLGDNTQQWSEEPVADHAYIQERLAEVAKSILIDRSRVVLFGFSQGAMVAGDVASCYPASYLGAILMSPGGIGHPRAAIRRLPTHARQVYFCFCGAEEQAGNVELTKAYAKHFETVLGATVTMKMYSGISKHTRPPDFMEMFPIWIKAILKPADRPLPKVELSKNMKSLVTLAGICSQLSSSCTPGQSEFTISKNQILQDQKNHPGEVYLARGADGLFREGPVTTEICYY